MLKSISKHLGIWLCFFLLGILVGGCIIASLPHPNHIHLSVMPNHGLNISPEYEDVIDWTSYSQATPETVTFNSINGSPCKDKNPSSTCVYNDSDIGVFYYQCDSSSPCDPGLGPSSGTRGGAGGIFTTIFRLLESVVLSIDRTFGFLPMPSKPIRSQGLMPAAVATASPVSPTPVVQRAALDGGNPDVYVGCVKDQATVQPLNISKPAGQWVYWGGSSAFTIALDQSICKGDMSSPLGFQSCQVIVATPLTYTLTDTSCKSQQTTKGTINMP